MTHYHVIAGLSGGYLPDYNSGALDTEAEAKSGAAEYVRNVEDSCDDGYGHEGPCIDEEWSTYITFSEGHGVQILEIVDCSESDCLERGDA